MAPALGSATERGEGRGRTENGAVSAWHAGLVPGPHPAIMQHSFPGTVRAASPWCPGGWLLTRGPRLGPGTEEGGRERGVRPRLPLLAGPVVTSPSPSRRYLFWTEWGQYPRIERSRLDGTERMVLVNVSISWPNGISVDYEVRQPPGGRPRAWRGLRRARRKGLSSRAFGGPACPPQGAGGSSPA